MDDDAKLKIILYTIAILSAIAVIGVWENFIKPIAIFFTEYISVV